MARPNQNVFRIESYDFHLKVEPLEPTAGGTEISRGALTYNVIADNIAHIRRSVKFSSNNRKKDRFEGLRYSTTNGHIINPRTCGINFADPWDLARFVDSGKTFKYVLCPEAGKTFQLDLSVVNGYEENNRDVHLHLPQSAIIKMLNLSLDLSDYVEAGYTVIIGPSLFIHRGDPIDHQFCELRQSGERQSPTGGDGLNSWGWSIEDPPLACVVDVAWQMVHPRLSSCSFANEAQSEVKWTYLKRIEEDGMITSGTLEEYFFRNEYAARHREILRILIDELRWKEGQVATRRVLNERIGDRLIGQGFKLNDKTVENDLLALAMRLGCSEPLFSSQCGINGQKGSPRRFTKVIEIFYQNPSFLHALELLSLEIKS